MKRQTMLVFDEQIMTSGADDYHTSSELNTKLGLYDQVAIHAVVDNPKADGKLVVQIEHSADGRNFLPKAHSSKPEVTVDVKAGTSSQGWGGDNGSAPSLCYVRLRVALSASAVPA